MTVPSIFDLCVPRDDVLKGTISDSDFAAKLSHVLAGRASPDYADAGKFFTNTYPTEGLKELLANVCGRLSGAGGAVSAIFRLDTSFGGGKTHGLIALVHAARSGRTVANIGEFVDLAKIPAGALRIAAFDGEDADPANGRPMGDGVRAHTPWGEIAYQLAGKAGFDIVRPSDEARIAPGADTIAELFGNDPVLIVLDELGEYLRRVQHMGGRDQLTAFLKALFAAAEGNPRAAVVYTLAVRSDGKGVDAFAEENEFLNQAMAELESVSGRRATNLNPTKDDETAKVLRRRLFASIDDARAAEVVEAYKALWTTKRDALSEEGRHPDTVTDFARSYPFHPDVLDTLTSKTATLANFQRVRGMLRILAKTVADVWSKRPADAEAIHLHHIDLGHEGIRREFTTRLQQANFIPAINNDVASADGKTSLARDLDEKHYKGLPPYASYLARTVFIHTLAFNNDLKGVTHDHLRFSMLSPSADLDLIDDAKTKFQTDSAYLDDRPTAPLRFNAEANLTQVIAREERNVDPGESRSELADRIRQIFGGQTFDLVFHPGGPWDVPDDLGDGKPRLALMSYDALDVGTNLQSVPDLVAKMYERKNAEGTGLRALRNNLVFLIADETRIADMKRAMIRRIALRELKRPERLNELAEHQRQKVLELEQKSEHAVAVEIQQCYRHILYPSRNGLGDGMVTLAHAVVDIQNASEDRRADILVCTDAAAEGLNFQFCGALINYDMPWNPMRVEQRIGRIDRLGQKFSDIRILNLHYEDTVEADVYRALRERIHVFETVVGGLQPILTRLPRVIEASVLSQGKDETAMRDDAVRALEVVIEEGQANAFDLADFADDDLEMPHRPDPALTLADLRAILDKPILLPPGVDAKRLDVFDYRYVDGDLPQAIRVTVDPAFFEMHADSVEFWTPGSPAFPMPSPAA